MELTDNGEEHDNSIQELLKKHNFFLQNFANFDEIQKSKLVGIEKIVFFFSFLCCTSETVYLSVYIYVCILRCEAN